MKIRLGEIAHARSGDKGGTLNLRSDAQRKSFGGAILSLEIDLKESELA